MVKPKFMQNWNNSRGDTLVEVTFALAILGAVLIGSTVVTTGAFRTGQTAKERTEVASVAQGQIEALRSFRDNHTWTEFRSGTANFRGVDNAPVAACTLNSPGLRCFHMVLASAAGVTQWVPQSGAATASVPGTVIEIYTATPGISRPCAYDFILKYQFTTLGNGTASNRIATKLANLSFNPLEFPGAVCP